MVLPPRELTGQAMGLDQTEQPLLSKALPERDASGECEPCWALLFREAFVFRGPDVGNESIGRAIVEFRVLAPVELLKPSGDLLAEPLSLLQQLQGLADHGAR